MNKKKVPTKSTKSIDKKFLGEYIINVERNVGTFGTFHKTQKG